MSKEKFTILGKTVREPTKKLETFPAPRRVISVIMETEEVTGLCPITGQPDWYRIQIQYRPCKRCLESKALKLYLWSFRQEGTFCENLSEKIAEDIFKVVKPHWISVEATMRPRGGISITSTAYISKKEYVVRKISSDDGSKVIKRRVKQ